VLPRPVNPVLGDEVFRLSWCCRMRCLLHALE
jgi:hypothetical protein